MTGHSEPLEHASAFPRSSTADRRGGTRVTVGTLALLALLGGLWSFHGRLPSTASAPAAPGSAAPPPPAVTVSAPLQRTLARTTDFTGQFSPVDQVELRAQVSGYLTEIHFTDGQIVHKGDLLFVIDQRPYEIQLQQAMAQFQTAQSALDLANKEVARSAELRRHDFESGEVLDQRTQVQQAALASIEQAKAAIRSAQLNFDFTRITAPFTGRIGARLVSLGSLISGGAAGNTKLASIVSLDPIHLDFDMSEADALAYQRFLATKQIRLDRSVKVSLSDEDAWPRRGQMDFLDNQVDRGSGTLHARATVANPDLLIAPGEFGRLQLAISAPRPVLLVPDAALVTDQSHKLVMVVAPDGTVVPKPVEIGPLEGDHLRVVTQGLAATDQVVINGLMRVRPGAKVAPHAGQISMASE